MRLCANIFIFFIACYAGIGVSMAMGESCVRIPLQPVDVFGEPIDSFCAISLYKKSLGVFYGPELKGGGRDQSLYLIWVSIKLPEEKLLCVREKSSGFAVPSSSTFVVIGSSVGISSGRLYLKRGFAPYLWKKYVDGRGITKFTMQKGDGEEIVNRLLSGKIDQEWIRKLYELNPDQQVIDEFTDEEREKLRKCYYGK